MGIFIAFFIINLCFLITIIVIAISSKIKKRKIDHLWFPFLVFFVLFIFFTYVVLILNEFGFSPYPIFFKS